MNPTILKRSIWSPSRSAARTLIVAAILGTTFPVLAQTIFSEKLGGDVVVEVASDAVSGRVFVLTQSAIYAILPDGSLVKNAVIYDLFSDGSLTKGNQVTQGKAITARDNQVYVLHGDGKGISWYEFQKDGDASKFVRKKSYEKTEGEPPWTDLTSETAGIVFAPYKENWGVIISCIDFRGAAATEHRSERSGLDPNASSQEIIDPRVSVFNGAVYAGFLDRHLLPGVGDKGRPYWDLVTLKISPTLQTDGKWDLPIVRQTHHYLGSDGADNELGLNELRATDVALMAVYRQGKDMYRKPHTLTKSLRVAHLDPNNLERLGEAALYGNLDFSHVSMAVSPANDLSVMAMATAGTISPVHANGTKFAEPSTTTAAESYVLANLGLQSGNLTWKQFRRIPHNAADFLGPTGLGIANGSIVAAGSLKKSESLTIDKSPISGPGSFYLLADESDLAFATDRHLTVQAKFHQEDGTWGALEIDAGSEVKPFLGRQRVADGQRIAVELPEHLYLDREGKVVPMAGLGESERDRLISSPDVVTRFAPTGYSVNAGTASTVTGQGRSVEILSAQDTTVTFFLRADHAVMIDSGVEEVDLARDHALALGNPEPGVKKHWVAEHEILTPQIDGMAPEAANPGTRYVVAGYESQGIGAQGREEGLTLWDTPQLRQQIAPFSVTGPARIRYLWKRQHGIQVGTSSRESEALAAIQYRIQNEIRITANRGLDDFVTHSSNPALELLVRQVGADQAIRNDASRTLSLSLNPGRYSRQQMRLELQTAFQAAGALDLTVDLSSAGKLVLRLPKNTPGVELKIVGGTAREILGFAEGQGLDVPPVVTETITGTGMFWIDEGAEVWIGTVDAPDRQLSMRRVLSGTGSLQFANGWSRHEVDSAFDYGEKKYRALHLPRLTEGAYLTWDFGNTIFQKIIPLGLGVDLKSSPAELEKQLPADEQWKTDWAKLVDFSRAPTVVSILEGPPGTTPQNAGVWSPHAGTWFPTRPVRCLLEWQPASNDAPTIVTEVTAGFPGDQVRHPYLERKQLVKRYPGDRQNYRTLLHPELPPVDLDPDAGDSSAFVDLPFSAGLNTDVSYDKLSPPAVVPQTVEHKLTIPVKPTGMEAGEGRHVLVFAHAEGTTPAKGDLKGETVQIRILETRRWDASSTTPEAWPQFDQTKATAATIGTKITSEAADTAKLGTGFVVHPRARYNAKIHDRSKVAGAGPIIPVNQHFTGDPEDDLVIIWYENKDGILWPYHPVIYQAGWPEQSETIVIASRKGSETSDTALRFDPERFSDVQIYHQPDPSHPGYNPNEEHALIAPSFQSKAPNPPPAAFALRAGDLNVKAKDKTHTSECRVLVQYVDKSTGEAKMAVYQVAKESEAFKFSYPMKAGEMVQAPYPLPLAIGLNPCRESTGGNVDLANRVYWEDHRDQAWAVSAGSLWSGFYYRMREDFWFPKVEGRRVPTGRPIRFLPPDGDWAQERAENRKEPQRISYQASWPGDLPILKAGETLTYAGGEYRADHPEAPGLPGVIGWKSGRVVYDSLNAAMDPAKTFDTYAARLISPLEERRVKLSAADAVGFREKIQPSTGIVEVDGIVWRFAKLSASLKKRLFFDPLDNALVLCGTVNGKKLGDPTLTQAPPPVYVLEPNILTPTERDRLKAFKADPAETKTLTDLGVPGWEGLVDALYAKSRNPEDLRKSPGQDVDTSAYYAGLESDRVQKDGGDDLDGNGQPKKSPSGARHKNSLGPGLALVPGPDLLKTEGQPTQYVTLVENDDPQAGGAVTLHIVKMEKQHRYRGAIQTVLAPNIFEEKITLRHTGDFGGNADDIVYEWYYRGEDGQDTTLPPSGRWTKFASDDSRGGLGMYQIEVAGTGGLVLGDNLFFLRYRHKDDKPLVGDAWGKWSGDFGQLAAKLNENGSPVRNAEGRVDLVKQGEWAGAGNSPTVDRVYRPQLVPGWIKRVLDRINPYEARFADFRANGRPAGYVSMIQQAGGRYEGPVALNADKDVIENVGLIELYQTLLERGQALSIDLSQPVSTPGVNNALQLAATRVQDLYMLLAHEAYADAQDPTLGYGSNSAEPGSAPPSTWTFVNQTNRLIDEELGLLRGVSDSYARPVYNRFYWNFTKGEGEAAYAVNYNLSDENLDGFIDEKDAMLRYPQGHGDAWGHYTVALKMHYDLLRNQNFNWQPRSEFYNLNDVVIPVDYLDERKFARAAAARAKAASEVVELTWKSQFAEGARDLMEDPDPARAWGVKDWARRAGQGSYLDWVTANSLIPAEDEEHTRFDDTNGNGKRDEGEPIVTKPGQELQRVDRGRVDSIAAIPAEFAKIETILGNAERGLNPLGLSENVVTFDLDPVEFAGGDGIPGVSHFRQIYARAVKAALSADAVFGQVSAQRNQVRQQQNTADDFLKEVVAGDRDLRNRLIELFGTPHEANIGTGKPYPAGYTGPDLYFYMYVDVKDLNQKTVPEPGPAFTRFWDGFPQQIMEFQPTTNGQVRGLSEPPSIAGGLRSEFREVVSQYFVNDVMGGDPKKRGEGSGFASVTSVNLLGNGVLELNYPTRASGYAFQAPADWGRRGVTGELQSLVSDLVQAEADLALSVGDYDALVGGFIDKARLLEAKHGLALTQIASAMDSAKKSDAVARSAMQMRQSAERLKQVPNHIFEQIHAGHEVIPQAHGVVVGTSTGIVTDPRAFANAVILSLRLGIIVAEINAFALEVAADYKELDDAKRAAEEQIRIDKEGAKQEIREALQEMEGAFRDEATTRIAVFRNLEALRQVSDAWRSKLHQAQALLLERQDFNRLAAGATQKLRYQDMSFRVLRNDATQSYRSAYDLAVRYAFLAAQAYDYNTNLDPDDAASAQGVLGDILSARTLGAFQDGEPVAGTGDLADVLARMRDNFDVLVGQLGINNAQAEGSKISLRQELFRVPGGEANDAAWITKLNSLKKADLWDVPEFRRYCRPFASRADGKQPGLVIPFQTSIESGKNVFGDKLRAGDHAFDPSLFATKIHGVGVWFTGYSTEKLARAPRVYLVPVGDDIMTIPDDWDLRTRTWKVADQRIPVPHALNSLGFRGFGDERRFSSFRAYGSSLATDPVNPAEMAFDTRLVGRSVWNTKWLLIIPSASLLNDKGIEALVDPDHGIRDIQLCFKTFGFSGN